MTAQVGFVDGFDHYPDVTTAGLGFSSTWSLNHPTSGTALVTGLSGTGQALRCTNVGALEATKRRSVIPSKKVTLNFAVSFILLPTSQTWNFIEFLTGALATVMEVSVTIVHSLSCRPNTGSAVDSADDAKYFVTGVRYFIQMILDASGSAGTHTFTVKVNGDTWIAATGLNMGATDISILQLVSVNFNAAQVLTYDIDDMIYLVDMALDTGELEVFTYGNDGTDSVQFTPLSSTNASNVDEIQSDGDTTYNYSNTPTHKDLFTFPDLPFVPEFIVCVSQMVAAKKVSSATRTIRNTMKLSGSDYPGIDQNLSTTYYYYFDHDMTNPDTSLDWEPSEVDDIIAGYELVV